MFRSSQSFPALGLCLLLALAALPAAAAEMPGHELSLAVGSEDAALWPEAGGIPGRRDLVVVLFARPIAPADHEAVNRVGGLVVAYVPENALLVRAGGDAIDALRGGEGVESIKRVPARVKISPRVADVAVDLAKRGGSSRLLVRLADDAPGSPVVARLAGLSAAGVGEDLWLAADSGYGSRLLALQPVERTLARALELAADPDVLWIEPAPEFVLLNDAARWVGQNFDSAGVGAESVVAPVHAHGIRGEGQIVGIIDDGLDPDHNAFWDPTQGLISSAGVANFNQRKVVLYKTYDTTRPWNNCSGEGHGSHTAGTVAGDSDRDGLWDPAAGGNPPDGMAPAAKLAVTDNGTTDPPGIPADLQAVFRVTYDNGARVHSNSWGTCGGTGCQAYTTGSHDVDRFMWEHPDFLMVFAAGNDGANGLNSVLPPSTAKNCITAGSTLRGTSANTISGFSSLGPAEDGRRKPTLTAPGSGTSSVNETQHGPCSTTVPGTGHTGTISSSGTSMATPAIAGYAALARQYFAEGWYPSGAKVAADGFVPSAALLKAVLINGARKMTSHVLPGTTQGYGRVSLKESLFFNDSGLAAKLFLDDHKSGLVQGDGAVTYRIPVTASTTPLKIALAWNDPPPALFSGIKLVNNLNLTVTEPNGTTVYLGNQFNTATGFSQTGGTADVLNVEELAWIQTPAIGTWTVTVTPANIPIASQPYALTVTGALGAIPGTPSIDHARVTDPTGNGDGAADPGESVQLRLVLRELGGAAVSGLTGTLTSLGVPGVTVTDGSAKPFPNLPANGLSAQSQPFIVALAGTVTCGRQIPLRLTLTDGVATVYTLDFGIRAGAPGKTQVLSLVDDFEAEANGAPPNATRWVIAGNTAVDSSIVTTGSADTGTKGVHLLQNATAPGSWMQTVPLNLSTANTAKVTFALWANDIGASSAGPFFRVEGCVGATSGGGAPCAPTGTGWNLMWGNPNHYVGATQLRFNSNALTPAVWSRITIDLTGTSLIGNSQSHIRFRFSQTGASTEATTAAYVDSVDLKAYSYTCAQPAGSGILLMVNKVGGKAQLTWTGGVSPYAVSERRDYETQPGPTVVTPALHDRDVLGNGSYYEWLIE